ncbi:MAG: hypothetical protein IT382_18860 [Deltaproteobacteria bacterium]|nr:hypothetical protein [Deltaproteobacteria bacterium]
MLRRLAPSALIALLAALAAGGCRPLLDGGWQGTAACPGEAFPLSAIFNETQDGEVEGVVYIEGINIIIGDVIARGDIDNGEVDPDDGSFSFDLQTDNEPLADFKVDMEYGNEELSELEGDIDQHDDNGELVQTCDLDLDRTSDPRD